VSNSGMYEELGRRTRHVVHGYGVVVFWMESGVCCEWKMCYGARSVFSTSGIEE
jgi:hypothetical protein